MRLLVVEDDADLRDAVAARLRGAGFAVDTAGDLPDAEHALGVSRYDALVLDRVLPSGDAIDLVVGLRRQGCATPVLFLTARDAVEDRVAGFEAGGDDYLVKPFAMAELVARVQSLARRAPTLRAPVVVVGDLHLDLARREVRRAGVLLTLTAKERCLLEALAARAGEVVSQTELIETCWDERHDPFSNVVEVHVAALRRKLGPPTLIHTVRGAGYVLRAAEPAGGATVGERGVQPGGPAGGP